MRAIETSKEIELENIEELINGEYEIDRSEIIETIQEGREKLISIQGNAGSGKSVMCKKTIKGKGICISNPSRESCPMERK